MNNLFKEARLSDTQNGIYMDSVSNPESTSNNIVVLFKLFDDVDVEKLKNAIEKMFEIIPATRVRIVSGDDGMPAQRISEDYEYTVPIFSLNDDEYEEKRKTFAGMVRLHDYRLYLYEIYVTPSGKYLHFGTHHTVFDGFTYRIVSDVINKLYFDKEVNPDEYLYDPFAVVEDEQKNKNTEAYAEEKEYYSRLLADCETDSLPLRDMHSDVACQKELFREFDIDDIKFNELKEKSGFTKSAFFTVVLGFVTAKYNYKNSSLISTIFDGRNEKNKKTVGMIVKTLPFVTDLKDNMTVCEFLNKQTIQLKESRKRTLYSFMELAADFDLSADVNFGYQGRPADYIAPIPGIAESRERLFDENSIYNTPIILEMFQTGEKTYTAQLRYRNDMFSDEFAEGFADAFVKTVEGFLSCEYIHDVCIADHKAVQKIDEFNKTEKAYDKEKTVVELFGEQVEKTPDNECLVFEDKRFTYKEVDEITDRFAKYLRKNGVDKNKVVGILIPRCEYMLLCALSVLKAGGAYLPLDPTYPPERLNLMVEDSGAMVLISTSELEGIITDSFKGMRIMTDEVLNVKDCEIKLQNPMPEDLFIVLYTSGSTGVPKGVMFKHSNTMVTAAWERDFYKMDGSSKISAYASFGFDANVFDMYPAITSGAALYIISESIRLDLIALQECFNKEGITHAVMTTQVGRQFALMEGTKTLKYLSVAGEKLTPLNPPADYELYNLYGPTEGSILATGFKVDKYYNDIPIGKAVDNVKLYVTDLNGKLLPPGASGELWISGEHVTGGYLNRPDKTAESYIENPFSDNPEYKRIYRTGDVVRFLCDGNIQFVGRRDAQVKIRGFRVELTEVEEVIRRFKGIKDATVAAFDDANGGKFIAAYVVSDEEISIPELESFIMAEKPPYMVPAVTMQIEKIPLNQNQKVNKKALPVPEVKAEDVTPPENELQQKIFDIVSETLGHKSFGIETDLYRAGLTSVGTVKLNVDISRAFDITVKISDLKENNTIKKLEDFVSKAAGQETFELLSAYPLTYTQQGIMVESMANPGSTLYNIPVLLRISKSIDIKRLEGAIKTAINAHPYIKMQLSSNKTGDILALRNDDSEPVVTVNECNDAPDYSDLIKPFELFGAPLYRISVYSTEKENYLFMDLHHIISDGTSEVILLKDITRAYMGEEIKKESYTGFEAALSEEKLRKSESYDKAKEYYSKLLSGCDSQCMPQKAPESKENTAGVVSMESKYKASLVKDFCDKNGLTENAFFNGVFSVVLSRFLYRDEVVYTTIYNGRSDSRLSDSVTMLVKTLPVITYPDGKKKTVEFIEAVRNQMMDSMANDIYSFAEISREYGVKSDIIFIYQGDNFTFDSLCGEPAELLPIPGIGAKAPVSINVYEEKSKFKLVADYRGDMFNKELISSLLDSILTAAENAVKCEYLKDISILSEKGKELMKDLDDNDMEYERVPIYTKLYDIAKAIPEKPAVSANGRTITFGELNDKSNIVANALIKKSLGHNPIIGMILEREVEVCITEMGIMKAGGAFLPMIPSYPDDRIDYCLTNADSPVVITTEKIKAGRPELFAEDKPYKTLTVEELLKDGDDTRPELEVSLDDLAYCIYTSGSTGTPKGVMINHENISNHIQTMPYDIKFFLSNHQPAGCLSVSAITFDMSIFERYLALFSGNHLCLASEYEIHNPLALIKLMKEHSMESLIATPSFMMNFLTYPEFYEAASNLKSVVAGAEPFPPKLLEALKKASPDIEVINGYGPTECTICSATKVVETADNITIGRPPANVKMFVFDKYGNPLPPYASGELIICGICVGKGYVKLPEKTKAAFFTVNGMPAYHSGDLVRIDKNSEIEFFGRIDNQVKLRGFRIELDEIENVIKSFENVLQSKVVVLNNGKEDYLAGYFTAKTNIDIDMLLAFMKTKLTYYMIPNVLMQIEKIPLTPNGKIDKSKLPKPENTRKKREGRAPKKSLEEDICEMFKTILDIDECFVDDDFFELGGTSLSASKVTMNLMSKGIEVEYGDVFDNSTPEALAKFIESNRMAKEQKSQKTIDDDRSEYRYEMLKYNTMEYVSEVKREKLGNVLLTGAGGFLGMHILRELIDMDEGNIYCIIRHDHTQSAESRLKMMLMYYFDDTFEELFDKKIFVIDTDITKDTLDEELKDVPFDTVINCAACVKHFVTSDILDKINVHGVENLIGICKDRNKKLVQISTTSVPGIHTDETYKRHLKMYENELFMVDSMDNKYCISKFNAEHKMLDAIKEGLRGKIIRVGNLMGRHSDGEFQMNFNTNMFMQGIRGFATLKLCPINHMIDPMRFSPIDCTAKAVVLLATTNDMFTAFNADNRYGFDEMKVIDACNRNGVEIKTMEDKDYYVIYNKMLGDPKMNALLNGLAAYDKPGFHAVETDNTFTANVLFRLGFSWPFPDDDYLDSAIKALKTLNYFDVESQLYEEEE